MRLTNIYKRISKIRGVTWGNSADRCHSSVKSSQPVVRVVRRKIIAYREGIAGQNSAQSNLHEGRHNWTKSTPQNISRVRKLGSSIPPYCFG